MKEEIRRACAESLAEAEMLKLANPNSDFPLKPMVLRTIRGYVRMLGGIVPYGTSFITEDYLIGANGAVATIADMDKHEMRTIRDYMLQIILRK